VRAHAQRQQRARAGQSYSLIASHRQNTSHLPRNSQISEPRSIFAATDYTRKAIDQDLQQVIEAWPTLPESVRQRVLPLVSAGKEQKQTPNPLNVPHDAAGIFALTYRLAQTSAVLSLCQNWVI